MAVEKGRTTWNGRSLVVYTQKLLNPRIQEKTRRFFIHLISVLGTLTIPVLLQVTKTSDIGFFEGEDKKDSETRTMQSKEENEYLT